MKNKVSLCIIGTEITRGIIDDKHVYFISKLLTEIGYNLVKSIIIPDDKNIKETLEYLKSTSDIVITTGGLGPTSDDITRDSIASIFNEKLVKNKEAETYLKKYLNKEVDSSNIKQIMLLKDSIVLENNNGTACGFIVKKDKTFICLPGPVKELRPMFLEKVIPFLKESINFIDNKRDEYSTYLIPESKLEQLISSYNLKDVTWATRVQENHISLYLSGKNKDKLKTLLKNDLKYLIQENNISPISLLKDQLLKSNKKISVKEKDCKGILTYLINSFDDCSNWYNYSIVGFSDKKLDSDLNLTLFKENNDYCFSLNEKTITLNKEILPEKNIEKKLVTAAIVFTTLVLQQVCVIDIISNTPYYLAN